MLHITLTQRALHQPMQLRRRHFCCLPLVPAASLLTLSARAQTMMTAAVEDQFWRDEARQRTVPVPVRLRWPAQSAQLGQAGLPVLLFSHGLGGTRTGGSVWGDAWAKAGFVVVHHAAIAVFSADWWRAPAGRPRRASSLGAAFDAGGWGCLAARLMIPAALRLNRQLVISSSRA